MYGRYWARTSDPQLVERGLESPRALAQAAWLSQILPALARALRRQIPVDSARFGAVWAQNSRLCPNSTKAFSDRTRLTAKSTQPGLNQPISLTLHDPPAVPDLRLVNHGAVEETAFGSYEPGRCGWLLDNVRLLNRPVPLRGERGLHA